MRRHVSRTRLIGVAALLAGLLPASGAPAEPAPPFPTLLRAALDASPRLAEGRAEVDRAVALALQARARPNPTASLYVESFGGTRSYADLGGQTTLQFDQPLELFGERAARTAVGAASVEAARAQQAQARLAYAVELAVRYLAAEASQTRIALALEALNFAREDLRVARLLVETGKEPELRSLQAQAEVGAAQARLQSARATSAQAFAGLSSYAATAAPITSITSGLLSLAEAPVRREPTVPDASPDYLSALAQRDIAARRVRVARLEPRPNPTISVGVRQIGRGDVAAVAGVSLPIPEFDQSRGNIAAAQAALRSAETRLRVVRLDLEAEAKSAQATRDAATDQLAAARQAETAAEESYRLTRLGWSGGKLPLSEVVAARRMLADARSQTLEARLARLTADAQLARLAGRAPFGDEP